MCSVSMSSSQPLDNIVVEFLDAGINYSCRKNPLERNLFHIRKLLKYAFLYIMCIEGEIFTEIFHFDCIF